MSGNVAPRKGLEMLQQMGERRLEQLRALGIRRLQDVREENRERLRRAPGVYDWHVNRWLEQINAYRKKQLFLGNRELVPVLSSDNLICYDIETDLACNRVWCIGAHYFATKKTVQFFDPDDETDVLQSFVDFCRERRGCHLVSFSNYKFERRVLMHALRRRHLDESAVAGDIDLGIVIPHMLIGPFNEFNLKSLAHMLGHRWKNPNISGFDVGLAYSEYLRTRQPPDWSALRQYNVDDVLALKLIIETIRKLAVGKAVRISLKPVPRRANELTRTHSERF